MIIGYAHISTDEQNFDLLTEVLTGAGCNRIVIERGAR